MKVEVNRNANRCGDLHVTDGEMTEIRIKYTAEKCE